MQDGLLSVYKFIFFNNGIIICWCSQLTQTKINISLPITFENFYTFTAGCGSGIINISKSNLSTIWLIPYNATSQSLNMAVCIGY